MKILYISNYFFPFIHGGAEISVFETAKALVEKGNEVYVLTPNYGTKKYEEISGVKIIRFRFPIKLKNHSAQLSSFHLANPIYWLKLTIEIIKITNKFEINIIHCQSSDSIPALIAAGLILGVPIVATFRDDQILCNYGYCLSKDQFGKTCDIKKYFLEDFSHYYKNKVVNKNFVTLLTQLVYAVNGRIRVIVLKFFAQKVPTKIVSSYAQKKTFESNGLKDTKVIHNLFRFPAKVPTNKPKNIILYATKLSSGKGLGVLLEAFRSVINKFPEFSLYLVGGGDRKRYEIICKQLGISKKVKFFGHKEPTEVIKIRQNVLLEVAPSVYPESFGRTALEALACGVPVVVSNRGGLPEIVKEDYTGYVVEPTEKELTLAIIKAIKTNAVLRKNICQAYVNLKQKFEIYPIRKHIKLYKSLL